LELFQKTWAVLLHAFSVRNISLSLMRIPERANVDLFARSGIAMNQMETKDLIRNCLASLKPRKHAGGFIREAAVLMPLLEWKNEYCFLLTLRTEEVQTHKGQISFPGGMREGKEDLKETALRETFEEVGIEEGRVEILGRFHDYISIHGYRVTPFAGFLREPFSIRPQVTEVAEVLKVPLSIFTDPAKLRIEKSPVANESPVYYYSYGKHQIWGLTARIIKDFIDTMNLHM
jgi:8-oxo-dGTP pyrophosphatase MutT (NUDIX family)